jgi:HAD superfamily hydrolase (TIGR01484 family)
MTRPRLIALDIDGTITGSDHILSEFTTRTLRRLDPAGIAGMVVTGRPEWSAVRVSRSASFHAPVIACNGALITDPDTGRRLWEEHVEPADAQAVLEVARSCGAVTTVWTPDAWYTDHDAPTNAILQVMLEREPMTCPLEKVIAGEVVLKVVIGGEPALLDRMAPTIEATAPGMMRSMEMFYEAGPANATKQDAMAHVLGLLDIDREDAWGFGDSDHDQGWMSLLGRAVAPANAFPSVLAIADEVIGHHSEDSVAHYLIKELFDSEPG